VSDDKKNTLSDISKNMESIRKLTDQSEKLTKSFGAINNNSAFKASRELSNKFKTPNFNTENIFKQNNIIVDALKNNNLVGKNNPIKRTIPIIDMPLLDNRSRAELKEDFETEILKIDREKIKLLIDTLKKVKNDKGIQQSKIKDLQENTINTLIKYERTISTFEALNSDLAVQLDYKKNELKFTTKADWRDKFRLFFFRVLWTLLFVVSLFAVGYIEQEYDWAHLPMSKYFNAKMK
jgi:hypothetical protein